MVGIHTVQKRLFYIYCLSFYKFYDTYLSKSTRIASQIKGLSYNTSACIASVTPRINCLSWQIIIPPWSIKPIKHLERHRRCALVLFVDYCIDKFDKNISRYLYWRNKDKIFIDNIHLYLKIYLCKWGRSFVKINAYYLYKILLFQNLHHNAVNAQIVSFLGYFINSYNSNNIINTRREWLCIVNNN